MKHPYATTFRKHLFALTVITAVLLCSHTAASQEVKKPATFNRPEKEPNFSGYLEMNYYRHYLWRGAEFGNDDVAQPELGLKYKNWGLVLTNNLNYNPSKLPEYYTKKTVFDEQDVELNYEGEKGRLGYKAAAMFYFYFHQSNTPNTGELYWRLKYPLFGGVKVFTETAHDIVYYRGAFFNNTGLVWEQTLAEKLAVECTLLGGFASKKYNTVYSGLDRAGLNILSAKAEFEYSLGKYYIGGMAEWNQYMNAGLKTATGLNRTNNYYFSFGLNF